MKYSVTYALALGDRYKLRVNWLSLAFIVLFAWGVGAPSTVVAQTVTTYQPSVAYFTEWIDAPCDGSYSSIDEAEHEIDACVEAMIKRDWGYKYYTDWEGEWRWTSPSSLVHWYYAAKDGKRYAHAAVGIGLKCSQGGILTEGYHGWCLMPFHLLQCSPGILDSERGECVFPYEWNAGKPFDCQCAGDPINSGSGNVYEEVTDYRGAGQFPLVFSRAYSSAIAKGSTSSSQADTYENVGRGWSTNLGAHLSISQNSPDVLINPCIVDSNEYYCPAVAVDNGTYTIEITIWHADGSQDAFRYQVINNDTPTVGTQFNAELGAAGQLTMVNLPPPLTGMGYKYIRSNDYTEFYATYGKLLAVRDPQGLLQTYQYTGGLLTSVTGPFGQVLSVTYGDHNRIQTLTNPVGGVYTYSYDAKGNLASVQYPDGAFVQYLYENVLFPHALTGILDANGNRYATWSYDATGRANESHLAGNADSVGIVYNSDGSADITEATGLVRHLTFTSINYVARMTSASAPCPACGDASQTISYDSNGFISSATNFNGNITNYTHDKSGLELSRTEAVGTPYERTLTTQWDLALRKPTLVTEPGRTTAYGYDDAGRVISKTVTDTAASISRTTSYGYDGIGLLTSVTDPLGNVTSFAYDAAGNLASITNALGQVTRITQYDANGYPLTIIDPNGVEIDLTYDTRQRLTSRTIDGNTTQFDYDPVSQLIQVTLPTGAYLHYNYDAAHRLTGISDNLGNSIQYTLDALGNHVREDTLDPSGSLTHTLQRVYDSLNHLTQTIGGAGQATQYADDPLGNPTAITDPLQHVTTQTFDALNRLASIVNPLNGETTYNYDSQDRPTDVTDPRGLTTHYVYDGFGDLIEQDSPDTGTTTYTYDAAGNRLTKTDARGITTTYTYDALNRLTGIHYPDSSEDVAYSYDQGTYGIGRLTGIQDQSGTTSFQYDARGNVIQKTVIIEGHSFTVGYSYDAANNLIDITYPDGLEVTYQRNITGRVSGLSATKTGVTQTVASNIAYESFGPVTSLTYGNGLTETRQYDQSYRLTALTMPGVLDWVLGHDADDSIISITDNLNVGNNQTSGYDALSRLTAATGTYGALGYSYDADGNRTSSSINGTPTVYVYDTASNRLLSVGSQNYRYDAAGNLVSDGTHTYAYNDRNRLSTVDSNIQYRYNGLGQRISKTISGVTTYFVYDEAGHMLGKYDQNGNLIQEHIWLGNRPIAVLTPSGLDYVTTDQLGAPRAITDQSQNLVWQWQSDPFGNGSPNENPSGLGLFTYNLRLPGQYFDAEIGHNYNYFRDYDPATGRYIESDPTGLEGGINTYSYAYENPINVLDPSGLVGGFLIMLNELRRGPYHIPTKDAILIEKFSDRVLVTAAVADLVIPPVIATNAEAAIGVCRLASQHPNIVKQLCKAGLLSCSLHTIDPSNRYAKPERDVMKDLQRIENISHKSELSRQQTTELPNQPW